MNFEKGKRKTVRSLTTKLINRIKDKIDTFDLETLEEFLDQLIEKETELKALDKFIEGNIQTEDELENEVTQVYEWRETIISIKSKLKHRIKTKERELEIHARRASNPISNVTNANQALNKDERTEIKLPKLEIKRYNGEMELWQEFWGQFESSIHDNRALSKIEKFSYLKTLLTGNALISIQGFALSEANYDNAVQILKDRFGKKEIIISSHVNKLLKLSPVRKSSHLNELRKLYDECITHVRSLRSLGIEINTYGTLLFPILIQLIPEEIVIEFNRSRENKEDWDIEQLLEFLKSEIESRERAVLFRRNDTQVSYDEGYNSYKNSYSRMKMREPDSKKFEKKLNKSNPTAAALNVSSESKCAFCSATSHMNSDCTLSISERKQGLLKQGRCFNCLKKHHLVRNCTNQNRCQQCDRKHHDLICETFDKDTKEKTTNKTVVTAVSGNYTSTEVLLQTASVVAENNEKSFNIRCLFDGGSQKTFVDEKLSRKLKLEVVGEEHLTIYAFASKNPENQIRRRVKITLRSLLDPEVKVKIDALEVPNISEAWIPSPTQGVKEYCFSQKIPLADLGVKTNDEAKVSLLIGSDNYWKIVTGRVQRLPGALVAMETRFGWVLNGTCASEEVNKQETRVMKVVARTTDKEEAVDNTIKKFWELDAQGTFEGSCEKGGCDRDQSEYENDLIFENFRDSIKFEKNRYIVRLPWNDNLDNLGHNFEIAKSRFKGLTRKFKRDSQYYDRYKQVIHQYIKDDVAEEADCGFNGRTYFMPHQAVVREDKDTTKFRVVFDASSHADNCPSLNECLHSGPNMYPDMLALLLRFRQNRIAFTADIQQAFLQILLDEEDRNAVKFLWNAEELGSNDMKVLRMTRVIFGAKSSPFILGATLKIHIEKYRLQHPKAYSLLSNSLYVDDLISGTDDEDEALDLYNQIKMILGEASFNMRKWKTNDEKIQKIWNEKENIADDTDKKCKVLGYVWNKANDTLLVESKDLMKELEDIHTVTTKRRVLKIIARLYDPIGILNPFTVRAKILLQEIWKRNISWDSPMPEELARAWKGWCEELTSVSSIEVPRHQYEGAVSKELVETIQLHCFTDASERAFGAALYIRYVENGRVKTNLVASKSRVSPLKKITLPRLELMGALIGSRLATCVQSQLQHQKLPLYFWTDSTIALHWIQSEPKKWKPFVQNRVSEIQKLTDRKTWKHCPGRENPADLLTRGEKIKNLKKNSLWWIGPKWLAEDEVCWPKFQLDLPAAEKVEPEKRSVQLMCQASSNEPLFNIGNYSSLFKVFRITGWIMRFIHNARNKVRRSNTLSAEELELSESYWIKRVQNESYPEEVQALANKKGIPSNSKLFLLNPFLDGDGEDGILRVGGRLQNANLCYNRIHPAILPSHSYLSDLLIAHCHKKVGHGGVAETLLQLREKFWIPKGRQRVKSVIGRCLTCRRVNAKPASQDMAPLPPDRINEAFPFEVSGIDFAGPLYTRDEGKAYIALFTCAVTRAVHLEIVPNLTTVSFLLAFRRFVARRGLCRKIYTDNAKTFKRADKDLQDLCKLIEDPEVLNFLGNHGIKWNYIVERAAWWGGFWERMVRSTKSCLKKILLRASLKLEELQTVTAEVESILNSRPLTYVYGEHEELEALTPGHFLIGRRLLALPQKTVKSTSSTRESLTKRFKYKQSLIDRVWKRWQKQYLLELRSAHETHKPKKLRSLTQDNVVLIHDDSQPKMMWKMGTVTQTHCGRDGKVRSCTVKLPNRSTIRRPVQLLYPLELDLC